MLEQTGYPYRFDENKCASCEGNCCIGESGYIWITKEECEKLHEWAGPATGIAEVDTLVRKSHLRPKNPTFRKGMPGEWNLAFEPHHVKLANKLFAKTLKKLGYEP